MTNAARPLRAARQAFGLVGAIAAGEATSITDVLAAVTPGGGKSLLPVIAGAHLIKAGIVERICWVVPRDSLRLQAEEAFADPYWRKALSHSLTVRAADNEPDPSRGLAGYVTTLPGHCGCLRTASGRDLPPTHVAGRGRASSFAGPL